jgi:multidrug efflux pump subunit AcrA (membrane-fusion protein)
MLCVSESHRTTHAVLLDFISRRCGTAENSMSVSSADQFEPYLEQLETAARRGDSLNLLLQIAQKSLISLVGTNDVVIVVAEGSQIRLLAGTPSSETSEHIGESTRLSQTHSDLQIQEQSSGTEWHVTVARLLSKEHRCVCHFLLSRDPRKNSLLTDACQTLADVLTEATGRLLLSDLHQRLRQYGQVSSFVHSLARTRSLQEWSQEIVQRGPEYLGKGRITVLSRQRGEWTAIAATGSSEINPVADAVSRNQQTLSILTKASMVGEWLSTTAPSGTSDVNLLTLFAQYEALGIRFLRAETVCGNDGSVNHAFLTEVFGAETLPPEPLVQLLRQEISEAARLLPREVAQSGLALPRNPVTRWLLIAAAISGILMVIPADFEIEVQGQAFPQERRRIFAPDDGIVEELLVTADQKVTANEPLLRLRNPERELDLNRVLGDIDSAVSRQQAIRATRTTTAANGGNNPAARSADLSSEEQQLERKLETLRQEQTLVEQQIAALTMSSPIDGVVYQSRLQEQLRSRPVQRGQQLLEIVNDSGEWQLDLQIPDLVVGYIPVAEFTKDIDKVEVQFTLNDDSRFVHEATLTSLDTATHLHDGQLTCLATVGVEKTLTKKLRPGQTVSARIRCGRKSLAFVWFREIVEFWQRKRFTWL